jgi:4-amino-4-deoxy-L-arabinose transferase-like glycosyltransferase
VSALWLLHVLFRLLLTELRQPHQSESIFPSTAAVKKFEPFAIVLLLVVSYLQFFHQLGSLGLVGPDEPRYAQVAREMAQSGDYVTPRLHGVPWFEKPILYYWVAATAFKAMGVSELAARLPSAVAGLLGVFAVFLVGRHWVSQRCGLAAGLILASSPMYFVLARAASTDMVMTSALTMSLACLYFAWFGERPDTAVKEVPRKRSSAWTYGIYVFLALAVLAKGPVGVVLAASGIGLFVLTTRRWDLLKRLLQPGPVLSGLAVALPWYWLCYRANGWTFIQEFLINHNLARFATDRYQHAQPFWFYIPVVFAGFLPWVFQIFPPAWRWLRPQRRQAQSELVASLFWVWALIPLLLFSFSQSKLPGYVLPMFPALALLAAKQWDRLWSVGSSNEALSKGQRLNLYLQAYSVLALGLALPLVERFLDQRLLDQGVVVFLLPMRILLLVIGTGGILMVWRRKPFALFGIHLAGVGLAVLLITERIVPSVDAVESSRQLAGVLQRQGFAGEPIFIYQLSRRVEYGLNFYLNTRTRLIYSESDATYPAQGDLFLVTDPEVEAESVLPHARTVTQTQFLNQKIVRMAGR